MGNRKTSPYEQFKSRISDERPKESRCVPAQTTILDFFHWGIFQNWASIDQIDELYGQKISFDSIQYIAHVDSPKI